MREPLVEETIGNVGAYGAVAAMLMSQMDHRA